MSEWKIGISSVQYASPSAPLLLHGTIEENLRTAKSLGYDAIEVHLRENEVLDFEQIRQAMQETGVKIAMLVTGKLATEGGCTLIDDRPYVESAALDGMKNYIDMAGEVGAGIVIGWARGKIPAGANPEMYLSRLGRNLKIINDYGKAKGVPVVIEVINHYEMNIFTRAEELLAFIDRFGLDNVFVHLDVYHMNLEEDDLPETIRKVGSKLGYVHLADSQRWYPGSGNIDFAAIFNALREINYKGYLTVECFYRGDALGTAEKAISSLNNMLASEN